MKKTILKKRSEAVQRYLARENPKSIYSSLRKSNAWPYKWVKRYNPGDPAWGQDQSKQPRISPHRTTEEIEEIVKMVRLSLHNKGLFCGDQSILWEPEDMEIQPLPPPKVHSIRTFVTRSQAVQ